MGLLTTTDDSNAEPTLTIDQQIALQHAKAAENIAAHLEAISTYLFNVQAPQLQGINTSLEEGFRQRYGRYPGTEA